MKDGPSFTPAPAKTLFARTALSWARRLTTGERDGHLSSHSRVASIWGSGVGHELGFSRPDAMASLGQGALRALRRMSTEDSESIFAFFSSSKTTDPLGEALPGLRAIAAASDGGPWGQFVAAQWNRPEDGLIFVACFAPGARVINQDKSGPKRHASNEIFVLFDQLGRVSTGLSPGGRPEAMLASLGEMWSAERRYPGYEEPRLALALFALSPDASLDEVDSAMEDAHVRPYDRSSFTARLAVPAERRALGLAIATPSSSARSAPRL